MEATTTINPGKSPIKEVGTAVFHGSYGYVHEALIHDTAEYSGVKLGGELQPDAMYSMAKGLRMVIPSIGFSRSVRKLQRVFVDIPEMKAVRSISGNHGVMIVRDDFIRLSR